MKNIHHKTLTLLVILITFTMSSCDELLDCIASTRPELPTKTLSLGYVGQPYDDIVKASVVNDSQDDDYDYFFTIRTRDLPPGITYEIHDRRIFFLGTPTQSGTYTFNVDLTIEYPEYYDGQDGIFEDDNRICFGDDSTSKQYTIVVQ